MEDTKDVLAFLQELKTEKLHLRLSPRQREVLDEVAARDNTTAADWLRLQIAFAKVRHNID